MEQVEEFESSPVGSKPTVLSIILYLLGERSRILTGINRFAGDYLNIQSSPHNFGADGAIRTRYIHLTRVALDPTRASPAWYSQTDSN